MLEANNLVLGYAGKPVVRLAHLRLEQGRHCLITGRSGSGKTTLLYALAGLMAPIEGTISIAGTDITRLPNAARDAFRGRHIGIIYQTLHLVEALSVLQNLSLVQYAAGLKQDAAKAAQLLGELGLGNKAYSKPEQLSHGQQQRVAIARAAINAPKIILGDEPTSALDDESCEAVMQMLLSAARISGASLVVATHDHRIKKHFNQHIEL